MKLVLTILGPAFIDIALAVQAVLHTAIMTSVLGREQQINTHPGSGRSRGIITGVDTGRGAPEPGQATPCAHSPALGCCGQSDPGVRPCPTPSHV